MKKVLVTGANGQLGKCIKDSALNFPNLDMFFVSKKELDIEDSMSVELYFRNNNFDYCINAAAYTNVEKAESDSENAFKTNAEGVKNLAIQCKKNKVVLMQVSTDYVFDGEKQSSYTEEDFTNPINVYGASKLKGEEYVQEICDRYFIFRTSWLYSQYGHNFLNTILKYSKEGKPLTITTEQKGTPTNANDLAEAMLEIIETESNRYGIYHYSNKGAATWFDFAKTILYNTGYLDKTKLAKTDHYSTFAARPKNSVLNLNKFFKTFNKETVEWNSSLTSLLINNNL